MESYSPLSINIYHTFESAYLKKWSGHRAIKENPIKGKPNETKWRKSTRDWKVIITFSTDCNKNDKYNIPIVFGFWKRLNGIYESYSLHFINGTSVWQNKDDFNRFCDEIMKCHLIRTITNESNLMSHSYLTKSHFANAVTNHTHECDDPKLLRVVFIKTELNR